MCSISADGPTIDGSAPRTRGEPAKAKRRVHRRSLVEGDRLLERRRANPRGAQETKKTILFVTHDVEEAVFLGDRCCVLSRHPGRIKALVPVAIPRARRTWKLLASEPAFDATREHVLEFVRSEVEA